MTLRPAEAAGLIIVAAFPLSSLLLLGGCEQRPYPAASNEFAARPTGPPAPTPVAGAPDRPPDEPGPTRPYDPPAIVAMAPIPNPGDPGSDGASPGRGEGHRVRLRRPVAILPDKALKPPRSVRPDDAAAPSPQAYAAGRPLPPPSPSPVYAKATTPPPTPKVYAALTTPIPAKPDSPSHPAGSPWKGVAPPLLPSLLLLSPLIFAILDLLATGAVSRRPSRFGTLSSQDVRPSSADAGQAAPAAVHAIAR